MSHTVPMKLFFLLAILLHNTSFSQQEVRLFEIQEEIVVEAETATQAQTQAQEEILKKYVYRFGTDLIGVKKYEQSQNLVDQILAKEMGRIAPIVKSRVLKSSASSHTVLVDMKMSLQSLRQVFETSGLMKSDVDSGVIIPFVGVIDQLNARSFKWWLTEAQPEGLVREINTRFYSDLQKSFKKTNFYLLNSLEWNFKRQMPFNLQKDYFRVNDYAYIESYFKFPLSLKGQVDILPSTKASLAKLQVRLEVILNNQGRVIAESSRSIEVEEDEVRKSLSKLTIFKDVGDDIVDQLVVALRKGVFETSMIQISLTGNLSYKKTENFMATLQRNLSGLKYISEKSIESNKRVYEVDFAGSSEELASRISKVQFSDMTSQIQDVSKQTISIKID